MQQTVRLKCQSQVKTTPLQVSSGKKLNDVNPPEALGTGDHETPLSICDFVRTVKTRKFGSCPMDVPQPVKS